MVRGNRNHNKFFISPGQKVKSPSAPAPAGFIYDEKKLIPGTLRWVIIVNALVILTLLVMAVTGCGFQPPQVIEAREERPAIEIVITGELKREDIKLMQLECHAMPVPIGTLIGDTVTAHNGMWISEQTTMRMAGILMMFDTKVMDGLKEKVAENGQ